MYAKIFEQIYDSSIAENPEARFTFMDLLVLADKNGVVDMTHEAIARRTNRPLDVIRKTIGILESPDPKSRRANDEGRRIIRLDEHRDWGWFIANYDHFRKLVSEEQRREKTRKRVQKHRNKGEKARCNADVTPRNDTKRKKRHVDVDVEAEAEAEEDKDSARTSPKPHHDKRQQDVVDAWNALGAPFVKRRVKLTPKRKRTLRARLKDDDWAADWREAMAEIPDIGFCCGKNDRGWVATLDWFLRPDTVRHLVEGVKWRERPKEDGPARKEIPRGPIGDWDL